MEKLMRNIMEKEIEKRIMEQCNIRQKVLIRLFPKTFVKVYHIGRMDVINCILKSDDIA